MENKDIIIHYSKRVWLDRDLSAIDEYFYKDAVIYSPLNKFSGSNTMKEIVDKWLHAFPDLIITQSDFIAENNKVVSRWLAKGTHLGGFFDTMPTHQEVIYNGVTIYRLEAGKVKEYWALVDIHAILMQLKVYRSISEAIDF